MSRRTLSQLPGWDESIVALAEWKKRMGLEYRTIGAFIAPPSITHMSAPFLRAMAIGLCRHRSLIETQAEVAVMNEAKVIELKDWDSRRLDRHLARRRLNDDWSHHWTGLPQWGGDTEL